MRSLRKVKSTVSALLVVTMSALTICGGGISSWAMPANGAPGENETQFSTEFFVSMDGNDTAEGTMEEPFLTLEGARNKIRELGIAGSESIAVNIREGSYPRLEESFLLEAEDSGSEENPIVYRAYEDENVEFTGNIVVEGSGFQLVKDETILKRLPESVRSQVMVYDLTAENGITEFAPIPKNGYGWPAKASAMSVLVDGESQTLARYPNTGFLKVTKAEKIGFVPRDHMARPDGSCPACSSKEERIQCNYGEKEFEYQEGGTWSTDHAELKQKYQLWKAESDIWTGGYFCWDWADDNCAIETLEETDNGIRMTGKQPSRYGVKGGKYYAYNLLCEIDSPGEWYLDRETGKLYLYPTKDISESNIELSMQAKPLVVMNEVSNVQWQKITFSKSNGHGIQMTNCESCTIAGCEFSDLGQRAVFMGDPENIHINTGSDGGHNNMVTSCDITRVGQGGVYVGGGNRYQLEPGNNVVQNCDISDFSVTKRTYSPAVELVGCGNTAQRNRIYDAPHTAIMYAGNDMNILGNEIFDVCYETADVGAIYSVRSWSYHRAIIKNNYIHDMISKSGLGSAAVYIDDLGSGATITENLMVDIPGLTTLIGGGRDNIITNNIQINDGNGKGFHYDDRGLGWAYYHAKGPDGECYGELASLRNHSDFDQDKWDTAYPNLAAMDIENYEEVRKPANAVIEKNIAVGVADSYGSINNNVKKFGSVKENETLEKGADIGFVNPDAYDFTVKEGSLIKEKLGDAHFDVSAMGLYQDEFRKLESMELNAPVLITPEQDSPEVDFINGARFTWKEVNGAGSYKLEVAEDEEFQTIAASSNTDKTSVMLMGLEKSKEYYWRVSARENRVNGAVSVSEIRHFTTSDRDDAGFFDGFQDFASWEPMVENGIEKGKPSHTTTNTHSGKYAYVLDEGMDVIEKKFGVKYNDVATIWMYDNMQMENGTSVISRVTNQSETGVMPWIGAGINVDGTKGKDTYVCRDGKDWVYTAIKRSEGWHEFKFDFTVPGTCVISIGGEIAHTIKNETPLYFDVIQIGDFWNKSNYPGDVGTILFDDITIGEPDLTPVIAEIKLPEERIQIDLESTYQLVPQVEVELDMPIDLGKELEYIAREYEIARVDESGLVTAMRHGTTDITVRSKTNPSIKAVCSVTAGDGFVRKTATVESGKITKIGEEEYYSSSELVAPGAKVTIQADEAVEDEKFLGWRVIPTSVKMENSSSESTSFIMPDSEVRVIAEYGFIASPSDAKAISKATPGDWFAYAHQDSLDPLLEDEEIVTEEDRERLERGWDVTVVLDIERKENTYKSSVTKATASNATASDAIRAELEEDEKIAFFIKNTLEKNLSNSSGVSKGTVNLPEKVNPVELSMEIAKEYRGMDRYRILGITPESGEVTEYEFTWEAGILTFTGEVNGIYGLVYTQSEDPVKPEEPDKPNKPEKPSRGESRSKSISKIPVWKADAKGWRFQKNGTYIASSWEYIQWDGVSSWFYFGEDGYMKSDWLQDKDGRWYYLNPVSNGTMGSMQTGWKLINGVWYYFNEISDGTKGAMLADTLTPDGFRVDHNGAYVTQK